MGCSASRSLRVELENELTNTRHQLAQASANLEETTHQKEVLEHALEKKTVEFEETIHDSHERLEKAKAIQHDTAEDLERTRSTLEKTTRDLKRAVDDARFLQGELNKRREALKDKDMKLNELNSNLATAQAELSKWYRRSIIHERELDEKDEEHAALEARFNQIANKKLMVLSEQGQVFELSSGQKGTPQGQRGSAPSSRQGPKRSMSRRHSSGSTMSSM